MIRVCIVALVLGWGFHSGGWWGAYSMLLVCGIVLPLFSRPKEERAERVQEARFEEVPARKGKRVDPTRPSHEDYAAMITNNFKRRNGGE